METSNVLRRLGWVESWLRSRTSAAAKKLHTDEEKDEMDDKQSWRKRRQAQRPYYSTTQQTEYSKCTQDVYCMDGYNKSNSERFFKKKSKVNGNITSATLSTPLLHSIFVQSQMPPK